MTNSVVGSLIEQMEHRCRFSDYGCEVKMLIQSLRNHEKKCTERTIKCPFRNCGATIQLKEFNSHADITRHSKMSGTNKMIRCFRGLFNERVPNKQMLGVVAFDFTFHLNLQYHMLSKCYVFSVWLAKREAITEKYRASIRLGEKIEEGDNQLSFSGIRVTSVENVPPIDQCVEENGRHCLSIPRALIENICKYTRENQEPMGKLLVELVISKI